MRKTNLELLLVDFDGVVSNGRFYITVDPRKKMIAQKAVQQLFNSGNQQLVNDWMRGKHTYSDIHKILEEKIGMPAKRLDKLLINSMKRMPLNIRMLEYVKTLRARGVVVSLFTDNMDIFDVVSIPYHKLDDHFDHIYSSSAYGNLKLENGILLEAALRDAETDISHTALVDDSHLSFEVASARGLATFQYTHYEDSQADFEQWLTERFNVPVV